MWVLRLSWTKTILSASGKCRSDSVLQHQCVVDGGVMVGHFDMAPAFQRREHHEQVGHAVALVFVIVPRGLTGFGRDRRARLDDQLFGGLVQAHEGTLGIARLLVGFQHVFHGGDEGGVGVGRDHPLPIAVRFEDVFFRVRPIVLSLAFSTMFNSTTFSSSRRRLQRAKPFGGRRAGQSDQFGLRRSVENPRPGGVRVVFALQRRLEPFLDELLAQRERHC